MSGTGIETRTDLAQLLRDKIARLQELEQLLVRETDALATGDHDELLRVAEAKQRINPQLIEIAQRLNEQLEQSGHAPTAAGLARYLVTLPDNESLTSLHKQGIELLRTCAAHNEANGGLVERQRSATERALHIFFGPPDDASRYHASGRLDGGASNRFIAEA